MRVCQFRHSRKMRLLGGEKDFGGQGWIRTIEVCDGRFTVCSLWPLGNPSTASIYFSMELVMGLEPATC